MFDYVRKHTKIMMGLMFLLIIPSFVLFGIDGYNRFREKAQTVALVGSVEITQSDWDAAHRNEVERIRAVMPTLDAKLLDSPRAKYATLERLVRERVLAQAAESAGLTTSDSRLARELQANTTIAALRRPDGSLDMDRYRQLLGSQGMSPEMFENNIRRELALRQVEAGIMQTGFATTRPAELALSAFHEKREVQLARFAITDFANQVHPTDAELQTYYETNQSLFQSAEQASVEYLVLDIAAVKKGISLNEQDLKTYYEQNIDRLSGPQERRASHILITAAKDAPASEREKARAKAQELLAQVRKSPDSFADMARKNSQDPGSATKGGDLDFFPRGAMVKPFEDAAFALKKGEISDVVESDFGYHIIKLVELKIPKRKSFEELRSSLEDELKNQQAKARFAEAAEIFTNGVYEQSDSLKPVAEKLKLEIQTANQIRRQAAPGATGVLANTKLLAALFSADAIEKKRNTEAVETAPSQLTSARIAQYSPAQVQPLTQVRQVVRDRLVNARAAELARKEGADKLQAWKANPGSATLSAAQVVSRDKPLNLAAPVLDAVLRADTNQLPALLGVDLGAQGYVVARVNKRVESDPAPKEAQLRDRSQYTQWWTQAENQAYYKMLQERFKVQFKVARPIDSGIESLLSAAP
jgi:peptidyl-prolyl cis-trans isomerase D